MPARLMRCNLCWIQLSAVENERNDLPPVSRSFEQRSTRRLQLCEGGTVDVSYLGLTQR